MLKYKSEEEKHQALRELFAERWEKSSQHLLIIKDDEIPILIAREGAVISANVKEDPFHLLLEIRVGGWLIEKDIVDPNDIESFLKECNVD